VRSTSRAWLWVFAALLLLVILFRAPIFGALGSYLVRDDPPHHADLVLVLAGDASGNRIRKGAELVREGIAPKVIVSGPLIYGIHECDLAIAMAQKAGYPESYFVHFEHKAHSTAEEARDAARLLESMGTKRVELVTSDYHTRRAGKIFRSTMPGVIFDVVSAPDEHFSPRNWWHDREGEKTFVIEWMKTVTSWFGA
jgi:uncharacterized SAM-binding protein YcdF (DUF218 family)